MKFSIIDPDTKQILVFPVSPEELRVELETKVLNFDTISLGDIEIPRGRQPIRISWNGLLPGVNQNVPYRHSNLSPNDIVEQLKKWTETNGAHGKKLRLIITGTTWNLFVFLPSFYPDYSGGVGDVNYSISFTEWRDMIVKERSTASTSSIKRNDVKPTPKTHTVKKGESLWKIAVKYTKKGSRWSEMWAINKSKSKSKNPDLIYPGEVFTLPSGW